MASRRKKSADEMSIEELRQIIIEKQRAQRKVQQPQYRRSKRMVNLEPVESPGFLDQNPYEPVEDEEIYLSIQKPRKTFFKDWAE